MTNERKAAEFVKAITADYMAKGLMDGRPEWRFTARLIRDVTALLDEQSGTKPKPIDNSGEIAARVEKRMAKAAASAAAREPDIDQLAEDDMIQADIEDITDIPSPQPPPRNTRKPRSRKASK